MNQNKVKIIVTVGLTLILSLYLGIGAASAQDEVLKVTGVAVLIAIVLGFGRRIWLLVPLTLFSSLSFRWVPGNWQATELAYVVTIFGATLLTLSRNLDYRLRLRFVHIFAVLVSLTVVQAYLRNPAGLAIFGNASVGARAYFSFAVSVLICLLFSVLKVPWRELFTMRRFAVIGGVFTVVVQWASYIPGLGLPLALTLGTGLRAIGGDVGTASVASSGEGESGRNLAGMDSAKVFSKLTVAYTNPMRAFLLNRWTFIVLFAIFGGLVSGFRSQLGGALLVLGIGVIYWQGFMAFFAAIMSGVFALMCLAILNLTFPLDGSIQRSLSFLPGTWEEQYVEDANSSTDWRVEMWIEALTSERWIDNKLLGDGLGFSQEELALQKAVNDKQVYLGGFGGLTSQQVSFLINGSYHSGPVSFVRTTGYVGLTIFGIALLAVAISSHRLLRSLKGSPYFGVAALICIPAIVHPIVFFFIFGNFSKDISVFFLNVGLLCFLRNNIDFNNLRCLPEEALEGEAEE